MNKFLTVITWLLLAGISGVTHAEEATRPNVIIINVDNHNKRELSYYGNKFIETPNIDRLMEQSLRFENYVCAGRCTSSRAALLTGRYHARTGAIGTGGAWDMMAAGVPTIAEHFRDGGYHTAMFGKWHIGLVAPLRPEDRGFEEVVTVENGSDLRSRMIKPGYLNNAYTALHYRFRHNGEWKNFRGWRTDIWFNEMIRHLDDLKVKDDGKPFFCYLATVTAHAPWFGPVDLRDYYKKKYERDEFVHLRERDQKALLAARRPSAPQSTCYDHAADISALDRNVGRLLDALKERGLSDNTIVIYTSDGGGGGPASAGIEEIPKQVRQSFIPVGVRWPGKVKPGEVLTRIANIDIMPTLLEASQQHPAKDIDGRSFLPIVQPESGRRMQAYHHVSDHQSKDQVHRSFLHLTPYAESTVRLANGKTVTWRKGELASREHGPEIVKQAEGVYEQWLNRVLPDFANYAYRQVGGSNSNPAFISGRTAQYEIIDGPDGDGQLPYFTVEAVSTGRYRFSSDFSDNPANTPLTRTGARGYEKARVVCYRKTREGVPPCGFDEEMGVHRVMKATFAEYFTPIEHHEGPWPAELKLESGKYLIRITSGDVNIRDIRVEHLPTTP